MWAISHQPTNLRENSKEADRRKSSVPSQIRDLRTQVEDERRREYDHSMGLLARSMIEGLVNILYPSDRERSQRDACRTGGHFRRMELNATDRRIPQNGQTRNHRHGFSEEFDLFTSQLRKIEEQSGKIPSGTSEVLSPS